jgi:subtilisin family serine protease
MCCFLIGILTSNRSQNNKFYYAFDEKIYLIPEENKMMVRYNDGFNRNSESLFLSNFSSDIGIKWRNNTMAEITAPSGRKKNELKTLLEARKEVAACQQFYTLENGMDICMFDEIIVQFLPGVSKGQQEDFNRKFRTEVVKTYEIFQILKVAKGDDVLEVANQYFESGLVKFSKPNFLSNFKPFQVFPNDTYFERQITLHNIGQVFTDGHSGTNDADIDAPEAWDITTGSNNIIIAVIDEGVTSNHPDLPNTRQLRLVGSDFVDGDADPSPTGNNNHGNACAGVIAATMNNNQGIAGIAPNCRIMPIRISYESSTVADFALAIRFAANNGAHIISNSWGLRDTDPFSFPPYSPNLYPEVVTAIQHAVNAGCVVLFAAGNTANHAANNDGFVSFPANVTIPGVITVGASDRNDHQANYSPTSNPAHPYNQIIDIVAPAHRANPNQITGETFEMWSIDIPGNDGYNPWPSDPTLPDPPTDGEILPNSGTNQLAYTARFGGTSHSCPVVAGVAALVLSLNSNLTNMEVFDILMNTAEDVGGYAYTDGRCDEMGHGRVNAYCAVQNALAPFASVSGADVVCTSGGIFSVTSLPPGTTINWNTSENIDRTSPQGSNPCNFAASGSGEGWIDASIITSCGNEALVIRKPVGVGEPVKDDFHFVMLNISTGEYVPNFTNNDGNPVELCPNTVYELWTDYKGPFTIQNLDWMLPNGWEIQAQYG